MSGLWRIAPCRCRWPWGCRACGGRRRVAMALTQRELCKLADRTMAGELYRSREAAERAIGMPKR